MYNGTPEQIDYAKAVRKEFLDECKRLIGWGKDYPGIGIALCKAENLHDAQFWCRQAIAVRNNFHTVVTRIVEHGVQR